MPSAAPAAWSTQALAPLTDLPGIGPVVAEKLASRGLLTLQDLWLHLPLRYEDRTRLEKISNVRIGDSAQIDARIDAVERGFRFRPQLKLRISDGSGACLSLRFFHFSKAQAAQLVVGRRLLCFGEARPGQHGLEMVHPSYRLLAENDAVALSDRLDPIYPLVDGIGALGMAKWVALALQRLPEPSALELLPKTLLQRLQLPSLHSALLTVHRPPVAADLDLFQSGQHPAQQRLAFEELLAHHISLRRQRQAIRALGAVAINSDNTLSAKIVRGLPYQLTAAQRRVLADIERDIERNEPMLRLVQGDVGSGKTIVAALAAVRAIAAGYQVALVAPTELLAEQHYASFSAWFAPLGLRVAWLAGKVVGKARSLVLNEISTGAAQLVVGTHAVMQQAIVFKNLALCIIDEQHRFGVHQRLALRDKGINGECVPHQLVMTATPIPRTLAMSAYADLDVSVIDELPPGRTPVQTVMINNERRLEVIERIRAACAEGRQAYWVCTLIEESEDEAGNNKNNEKNSGKNNAARLELQAAQTVFTDLTSALPELRLGLLHGRMKPAEKQQIMAAFKAGELQLLVATTVIEVGVDVPRASLMVIDNAERLGLAQLHQLRGRVGRGSEVSSCVLLYQAPLSALARERLEILRASNDGFLIAEKDLQLRGPGELLGTRQAGSIAFRIADLVRDAGLLPQVQSSADYLLQHQPMQAEAIANRWVGSSARFAGA